MASKSISNLFIFILLQSACVFLGFSVNTSDPKACVQKLMPCQPYLHAPANAPATCCLPLKEMVVDEIACLCSVMNNPALMKTFNVTEEDTMKLAKACGAKADLSLCKTSPSPTSPSVPPAANSSTNSSTPAKKNAGNRMQDVEKFSLIIAFFVGCSLLVLPA
ncbi:non-specific lipid transfer protein GPI-anchored 3-like [Mercurialis annua]|uniref:non-specific lipid transfer protein GPI-anchored 3-like n=1 Tax=Mercurialis annua TaxID=3986 RepID=UPI00215E3727|nr:non-specific lipid transfer protein GPI-anchored 3-like [Mercurialis annua]